MMILRWLTSLIRSTSPVPVTLAIGGTYFPHHGDVVMETGPDQTKGTGSVVVPLARWSSFRRLMAPEFEMTAPWQGTWTIEASEPGLSGMRRVELRVELTGTTWVWSGSPSHVVVRFTWTELSWTTC